jgi:hypothetical protein
MTLTELITEVYNLTNRPELSTQTLSAVRAATLKMHHLDYFDRDLVENPIDFGQVAYLQSFQYKQLFPRWRAIKYLRYLDITTSPPTPGEFFNVITPEEALDSYAVTRTNVLYLAGSSIQINALVQFQYGLMGCYLHPDITTGSFTSWIADEHPYAIVYEAARTVCKLVGLDQQYSRMETQVAEEVAALKITAISTRGY